MTLPFTESQFLDIFRQYNTAVWPMQVLLVGLALCAVALALRPTAWTGRLVALYLAVQWLWTGVAYHWLFFSRINPAARVFAVLWILGAIAFACSGVGARALSFRTTHPRRLAVGCALIVYALLVYPVLGHFGGRAYPFAPAYGAPCPVAIYTFGLLWLARGPVPRYLLPAPILWAAIGSAAAFSMGVVEDFGLLVAGVTGVVLLFRPGAAGADTGMAGGVTQRMTGR